MLFRSYVVEVGPPFAMLLLPGMVYDVLVVHDDADNDGDHDDCSDCWRDSHQMYRRLGDPFLRVHAWALHGAPRTCVGLPSLG